MKKLFICLLSLGLLSGCSASPVESQEELFERFEDMGYTYEFSAPDDSKQYKLTLTSEDGKYYICNSDDQYVIYNDGNVSVDINNDDNMTEGATLKDVKSCLNESDRILEKINISEEDLYTYMNDQLDKEYDSLYAEDKTAYEAFSTKASVPESVFLERAKENDIDIIDPYSAYEYISSEISENIELTYAVKNQFVYEVSVEAMEIELNDSDELIRCAIAAARSLNPKITEEEAKEAIEGVATNGMEKLWKIPCLYILTMKAIIDIQWHIK